MNREIKFRGLTSFENHWIIGMPRFFKSGRVEIFDFDETFYVKPETICQFTGKKDKNEKEIYEGDVCKCRYYKHAEKDLYLTQKVVFKHASFFVVAGDLKPDLETETYTDCPLSWVNEIEIIGNIYENPELINGDS